MTNREAPLPPGSLGLPFIGERPQLLDNAYLMRQYERYGPIFKTRVLGRNIAVFMGPEANRFLLATGMKYFSWRDGWPPTFKALLGESLFVQDGEEHKQKRRLIMPAFHQDALHHYLDTMLTISERYLKEWEARGRLGWLEAFKQFTFEVASVLLTGSSPDGADIERLSKHFITLTSGFVTVPVPWAWAPYGKALKAREVLLNYIDDAIEHRRREPMNDALGLPVGTRDEEGNALTNEELRAQTLLMLFAGHETSASMLTSMMMVLAQRPDIKARARAEQMALGDAPMTMDTFRRMPYLEQILKETERLYPPVPAGFRGVVETFEFNGYQVPKGWTALYTMNAAHLDPAVYHEPYTYDPDRFGKERGEGKLPYSLVGFGGGARFCVGYAFAQLEMKVMASHLLRYYDWALVEGQNLDTVYRPTLMPKGGLQVNFWRL